MAEVVLFHHVQGLTAGVRRLADELRAGGHTVHTPDFFEGATFGSLDDGFAAVRARGEGAVDAWADRVADGHPPQVVYAGISLGVMPAQRLAQTRPGAAGALLLEGCAPASAFGEHWPVDVPVQVHGMEHDPFFGLEGDVDAARELVSQAADGELFVYRGDVHLFTDSSLPSHDEAATALVVERALALLARV
ncbi:MAG: dienelactone hydrolase family protein [Ornithinibacter sp.]